MDNRPIGVFDSGLGGLTAFRELRKALPGENILYFGDTGRVPYGTKTRSTILKYADQDIRFLLSHNVKMVIAACGTVSANLPQNFAEALPVPFAGVIRHTVRAACAATKNGKIGVIATPATVKSGAFEKEILAEHPEFQVFSNPCALFVPLVESGFIQPDNPVTRLVAQQYLEPLVQAGVDTLILGCTHYPIIAQTLQQIMGQSVTLINSGKETAAYAKGYLERHKMLAGAQELPYSKFFVSDSVEGFSEIAGIFLGSDIHHDVQRIDLEEFQTNQNKTEGPF